MSVVKLKSVSSVFDCNIEKLTGTVEYKYQED